MRKSRYLKGNRYWRILSASGIECDNCKNWTNFCGCMENRQTKKRLCKECYKKLITLVREGRR